MAIPRKPRTKTVAKASTSRPPAKKAAAKKTAKKTPTKAVKTPTKAVKAPTKSVGSRPPGVPRKMSEYGFSEGSQSDQIARILVEGGPGRQAINERVRQEVISGRLTTRGNPPPVSVLLNSVIKKLEGQGYEIEQSWVMKKAGEDKPAKAAPTRKRAAKKAAADTPEPAHVQPMNMTAMEPALVDDAQDAPQEAEIATVTPLKRSSRGKGRVSRAKASVKA